jgi:hypothetical protein
MLRTAVGIEVGIVAGHTAEDIEIDYTGVVAEDIEAVEDTVLAVGIAAEPSVVLLQ